MQKRGLFNLDKLQSHTLKFSDSIANKISSKICIAHPHARTSYRTPPSSLSPDIECNFKFLPCLYLFPSPISLIRWHDLMLHRIPAVRLRLGVVVTRIIKPFKGVSSQRYNMDFQSWLRRRDGQGKTYERVNYPKSELSTRIFSRKLVSF